jgi:uncharacterized protein YxeA
MKKIIALAVVLILAASCGRAQAEQEAPLFVEPENDIVQADENVTQSDEENAQADKEIAQLNEEDAQLAEYDENNTQKSDYTMSDALLTSEEFLRLVSKYEEQLGVTVADFDEIDIDDFIEQLNLTEYVFYGFIDGGMIFIAFFNRYVSRLGTRAKEAYFPAERRMVDSTEEELERFKEQFFEKIGGEEGVEHVRTFEMNIREYAFHEGEHRTTFMISRTMHFEQLAEEHGWSFHETVAHGVMLPVGNGMYFGTGMFISQNGKFFIIFEPRLPHNIETIQAFMEIED